MTKIHNTAIIHPSAMIDENVEIGPYAIIGEEVKIGKNTKIGPFVVIEKWTTIGKDCQIYSNAKIGGVPQDFAFSSDQRSYCEIGDGNIIHEFVTIHRGTKSESKTVIGNNNMFMVGAHIGHNAIVNNNVVLVNFVSLGGYVQIDDNAFISAGSQVHQFVRIGKLAMLGALSTVVQDVPPFMLTAEHIAVVRGLNIVGLRRAGYSQELRNCIKRAYKLLYHSGYNISQALEKIINDDTLYRLPEIKYLVEFIKNSKRGICAHYKRPTSDVNNKSAG